MIGKFLLPRRFLRHALSAFWCIGSLALTPLGHAQTPAVIRATVGSQEQDFETSENEIRVVSKSVRPEGELKKLLQKGLTGAVIEGNDPRHAVVRLRKAFNHSAAADHKDEISALVPDAELQPVLYPAGLPHTEAARHFATSDVLVKVPEGKTAGQLVTESGAEKSEKTLLNGYVMLHFSSPHRALASVAPLRASGVDTQPQLAVLHTALRAVPKDQFFQEQWHLLNLGQGGGKPGIDANVMGAWDTTLGAGINIAIVDNGLQTNHPDLQENCPAIQTNFHHDFNNDDNDPQPGLGDNHGTAVGGVAAARQNNGSLNPVDGSLLGVSGAAPEAKLVGIRLISAPTTDFQDAAALSWSPIGFGIDISNNSWGPGDGIGLGGPGPLAKAALAQVTVDGRRGNGQITVFAGGNGALLNDNSNYDGFSNSRYVVAVGAVDNLGGQAFYSEPGANLIISAPSNGGTLGITTTDRTGVDGYNPTDPGNLPDTDYTNDFGGTSSAAPLTSGGIALMLAANGNNLGWRDVKEILASTARQLDPGDPDWVVNDGGFHFNHRYGGGMIDLRAAVVRSRIWSNLGTEVSQTISIPAKQLPTKILDNKTIAKTFDFSALPNLRLEQIEIVLDISHRHRSDLLITITSPSGIISRLAEQRPNPNPTISLDPDIDYKDNGAGWTFTSTHYWGDNSIKDNGAKGKNGVWIVTVSDQNANGTTGTLNAATVRLIGATSPQTRILFEKANYSISEAQVPDPANPGQFINAKQTIRVRRLGPLDAEATVDYQTTIGSATPQGNAGNLPPDYVPVSGTLHFSAKMEFADTDISVEILPDNIPEPTEQVNVILTNPTGGTLGGITLATIDIIDSTQNSVTVAATDNTAAETLPGATPDTGTFTISRLVSSPTPLTVHFTLTGTATYDDGVVTNPDYEHVDLTATIPAGKTSVDVVIRPIDDSIIEGVETVILTLQSDASYAIGTVSSAQINIVDNDRQKIQIDTLDNLAVENDPTNTGHLQIIRSIDVLAPNAFDLPLLVDLSLSGTQLPTRNYLVKAGAKLLTLDPTTTAITVEIPAGQTVLDLYIIPVDDTVYQATKTVVIDLLPNPNYAARFGFLTHSIIRIAEDDPLPNAKVPKVHITKPLENEKLSKAGTFLVTAEGTATDDQNVQRVLVRVNDRPARIATLSSANDPSDPKKVKWTLDITQDVILGPNVLTAQSRDGDLNNFNDSTLAVRHFKVIQDEPLTITVDPPDSGKVTDAFKGTTTQKAGFSFDIVAKPNDGNVFAGWYSDTPAPNTLLTTLPALTFTMPADNLTLHAKFQPSPFAPAITGSYTGLVQGPSFSNDSSGLLKVNVTKSGAFTGKLIFAGRKFLLKGTFTVQGTNTATYSAIIDRGSFLPLTVNLSVDTDPAGTQQITGTVNNGPTTCQVVADRALTPPTPPEGKFQRFTFYMPPASPLADPAKDPHGMGVGKITIKDNGVVQWVGRLADHTLAGQSTTISKNGTWPFFSRLYGNTGVILGMVTQPASPPADYDLSALLNWSKPTSASSLTYPLGFKVTQAKLFGAKYTHPADSTTRVLSSFDAADNKGTITIDDGNLRSPLVARFKLKPDNTTKFDLPNPQNITLNIRPMDHPDDGLFEGTFIHPISGKVTNVDGVVFQKSGKQQMIGTFLGKSESGVQRHTGRVIIQALPPAGP